MILDKTSRRLDGLAMDAGDADGDNTESAIATKRMASPAKARRYGLGSSFPSSWSYHAGLPARAGEGGVGNIHVCHALRQEARLVGRDYARWPVARPGPTEADNPRGQPI